MASNHGASQLEKGLEILPSLPSDTCTDTGAKISNEVSLGVHCMYTSSMLFQGITFSSHIWDSTICSTSWVESPAMDA